MKQNSSVVQLSRLNSPPTSPSAPSYPDTLVNLYFKLNPWPDEQSASVKTTKRNANIVAADMPISAAKVITACLPPPLGEGVPVYSSTSSSRSYEQRSLVTDLRMHFRRLNSDHGGEASPFPRVLSPHSGYTSSPHNAESHALFFAPSSVVLIDFSPNLHLSFSHMG